MNIKMIHEFNVSENNFKSIQKKLSEKIIVKNRLNIKDVKKVAGIDIAYLNKGDIQIGFCSVIVFDYETYSIIERQSAIGCITTPYKPGYLSFREIPLVLDTLKKLEHEPDILVFDGNGILHPQKIGLASHISLFLDKPTIGVAKSYFNLDEIFYDKPENKVGAFSPIIVNSEKLGIALTSKKDTKPVFVSPGNYIDFDQMYEVILHFCTKDGRIPMVTRLPDIETRILRKQYVIK